ncbi:hypothetical protein VP01_606g7 [Puccinia sorghi]|uniref:Uncharacterized protein n=1 Tax=Puccinia sorghi TaxID=27349 RepID=A0A0L6UH82_9BASI|nr:hypothetical protein VP01_606g7 [Puccinia sorghi]
MSFELSKVGSYTVLNEEYLSSQARCVCPGFRLSSTQSNFKSFTVKSGSTFNTIVGLKPGWRMQEWNVGFRQGMLKAALDTAPQLTEKNYSVWKDKVSGKDLPHHMIFDDFLYLTFKDDAADLFITKVKFSIKKMIDIGIYLPQDILAYLILFKLNLCVTNSLSSITRRRETRESATSKAALFAGKRKKSNKNMRGPKFGQNQGSGANQKSSCCAIPKKIARLVERKSREDQSQVTKSRILLDSVASAHIFNDKHYFSRLDLSDCDGTGEVVLQWRNQCLTLKSCVFVPNIVINLIIPGCLEKKG